MGEAVYAIDDFPDDDLLWRIEWIGGVGYNTSVPSDPLMDVCMAQLPAGETNPLSARSRSSQTKRTVRIGVGRLPVDLFYRSLNNRVDFLGKTTPSLIGPPLAQKHRDTLRVVMGVDPTVDCSWMPVEDPGDLLHMGARSLGLVHFEERFKD